MKRSIFLIALVTLGFWSAAAWAQKPKLNTMTFRVDGKTVTCTTGEVTVSVTLVFSTAMRDSTPKIQFGLAAPYALPVPFKNKTWTNGNTTFVASFDINSEVPSTADGLYKFLIRKAYAAGGDTIAPALSDTLKNSSDQPATLYISRKGKLTASTNKVDFGTMKAGQFVNRSFTIKNVTCANLTLSDFIVTGPFLLINPPTGTTIAPDANLTLNLRFNPVTRKTYNDSIKIIYTSNQKQDTLTVKFTGVARGAEMVFVPTPALNFGTIVLGDSAAKTIRLTNRAAAEKGLSDTLKVTAITVNPVAGYTLSANALVIAPGDTKSVALKFKPTEIKTYNSSLTFVSNDLTKPEAKISFAVTGAGQKRTLPQINTLTFSVDGKTATCTAGEVTVSVTLVFNTAMRDSTPQIQFGLAAPYSLPVPLKNKTWTNNNTTFVASFAINSEIPSTADGLYKFLIRKAYSASGDTIAPTLSDTIKNSADQSATLYISRQGKLTASINKVDFGTMKAGQFVNRSFTIKNVTCANLTLNNFTVTGPFLLINPPTGASIAPDANLTLNLRFSATTRKTYNDSIKIKYTSNQQQDSLTVKLTGLARGAEMVFVPTPALNFGTLFLGDSATTTIRLTNRVAAEKGLSDTLKVTAITLNPAAGYTLSVDTLVVAPGDTKSVALKFKPTESRNYNSNLTFTSNDLTKLEGRISFAVIGAGQEKTLPPQIPNLIITWPGGRSGYTNGDFLEICLDVDISQIKDVRWKFWASAIPPTSPNDTTGTGRFIQGKCFRIPLRGVLTSGRWNCYIWLEGRNGASGYRTPNVSVLNYDTSAPIFSRLPYVTVGWTGGFAGYTNADNLVVCWEATDASGIAAVRWKFSRTRSVPANANDTTAFGGTFNSFGVNCVTIPLKGKITEGRWYCYLWLVDGSGNSSYLAANTTETLFKYDLTAPGAPPAPSARNIPLTTWFNSRRSPLILTLPLVSEGNDIRDAASVRWKFKTPPTTATTAPNDNGPLARLENNSARFSVIFNSPNWCGDDTLYYWVVDSAGNWNSLNYGFTGYKFDMCPPVIARALSGEAVGTKNTLFVDTLKITDHNPVNWDSVLYRFGGARANQPPRRLEKFGSAVKAGDLFTQKYILRVPADGVTTRGIEFTTFAKDTLRNLGMGPITEGLGIYCEDDSELRWTPVRVRTIGDGEFRIDKDGNPLPLPNGRDATNYTLFSVPFELDKRTPKDVLEDDLGAYDRKMWRFFEYRPELGANSWVEYNSTAPTISPFTPGRAFFMIVGDPDKVIDSGIGKTVTTGKPDTLILQEGWNLFGNPFNFPIHRDQLRLVNSSIPESPDTPLSILTYERRWDFDDVIEPWKGYAIYVKRRVSEAPIRLIICPIATTPRIGKTPMVAETSAKDWTLQISAQAGAALDSINYVGARSTASAEYDDFDRMEPPVIGDYVSVYVDNEKWTKNPMKYTADFRPTGEETYEWPLRVNSNTTSGEVILQFSGMANLPAGFEAYLVDEAYGVARNLRHNPEYRFVAGTNGVEKALKLLVGKPEALQKYSNGIALVPMAFELSQNFPNPFAAKLQQSYTAIRYTLPKSANVTVEVYNMLGQKVRTLVAGQAQAADYYLATWDGRDEAGKEVSSGVYIYRLLAESNGERFTSTKKLLLVK
jgi:FlgD Ig-like domain/Abnormal spindle-like microcephaly-assoc'd, ASPM-SPD-2-Hydin/HYDIN/CFA65/VesB-like, Ig-like domain